MYNELASRSKEDLRANASRGGDHTVASSRCFWVSKSSGVMTP